MARGEKFPLPPGFWLWHLAVPSVLFLLAATYCELTQIDLIMADRFYDFTAMRWPAREAWWAEWLLHKRGSNLIALIAAGAFLLWLGSYRWRRAARFRWQALYLFLAIGLATGTVTATKKITGRHCPWDMVRYGGSVPYTSLSEGVPDGCRPGACFPAGHASGGFALAAGYFACRDRRRRAAVAWLGAGIILGSLFGFAQMARGAHFFSHNVWSLMICWLTGLVLYLAMRGRLQPGSGDERKDNKGTAG